MRKLNDMFHIEGEQLVKTSNGQSVPEDEPIFILRGRDALAEATIGYYINLCWKMGVPEDRRQQLLAVGEKFHDYAKRKTTKTPGSTHGN